jgi:hypothetical protein
LGADGDGEGFGLADEDEELLASGDGGVEEVALEQEVMLHGEGNDDGGEFGALGFVDGDGIGEREFVEFAEGVGDIALIEADDDLLIDGIDGVNGSDIAIEDLLVVVVFELDDFVADLEAPAEAFDVRFGGASGVKGLLKVQIEFTDTERPAVHGGEHLDLLEWIELEPAWDAVADDFKEGGQDGFGRIAFDEVEVGVGVWGGAFGEQALVDAVRGGDDAALGGLAKNLSEADDGQGAAIDEITEDVAGADGGELIDVADEEEGGVRGHGAEQLMEEGDVDHGTFIDDEKLCIERVMFVAGEAASGLDFEQAMDGLGVGVGGFGEAFGGATGGGAEKNADLFRVEDEEQGADEGGFPDAGAAGDDEEALGEGEAEGILLGRREVLTGYGFGPGDGLVEVDGRVGIWPLLEAVDEMGDARFGALEGGEEEERLVFDGFEDEVPLEEGAFERLGDNGIGDGEQLGGGIAELFGGQGAVSGLGGFEEDMIEAGGGAEERIERDTEFLGDLIGGFETDAGDIAGEDIGVGAELIDGMLAVGFEDADGAAGADAVGMEEDHDGADDLLFGPSVFDLFTAFGADAIDLFEACGSVFNDVEDGVSEAVDQLAGVDGTDAFDHAAAEVFFDAFAGVGRGRGEELGMELESVIPVAHPPPLGIDPFAGGDAGERSDEGDEIAVALDFEFEDGEAGIFVEEGDPFDEAGQALGRCRGGGVRAGVHGRLVMEICGRRGGGLESSQGMRLTKCGEAQTRVLYI